MTDQIGPSVGCNGQRRPEMVWMTVCLTIQMDKIQTQFVSVWTAALEMLLIFRIRCMGRAGPLYFPRACGRRRNLVPLACDQHLLASLILVTGRTGQQKMMRRPVVWSILLFTVLVIKCNSSVERHLPCWLDALRFSQQECQRMARHILFVW